ncbi:MAG: single-stranded-DNA-specific exonuclease RecJ [Oscillospiraceae bacterium]|jgi:single-stranded-DNA-specific exonuclease|nr:single-stranded-DNA-specific exonuclease RecJ [Oscillospiraceae bacterium]
MGIREWVLPNNKALKWENNISEFLFDIIKNRNIEKKKIKNFLYNDKIFSNPYDFMDMDKLVKRVKAAIENSEKICIYGDYDADGITATALMYSYLKKKGANAAYFIPDREKDGYGLNIKSIDDLKQQNVQLIFTVDNGISSEKEIEYANSLGIDTIITDHHKPPERLPNAAAIVNPHRYGCKSEFKNFSGVGVAFKAIEAMEKGHESADALLSQYSDLVAIGTIGDSIELFDESRYIVKTGLENISGSKRPGIIVILKRCNLYGAKITSTDVSFKIVPKINAAGRMAGAELSLKLLLSETEEEAEKIYSEIHMYNEKRKETEKKILLQIDDHLKKNPYYKYRPIIIAYSKGWHHGVTGIAASRITDKYGKPSILITYEEDNARGSCRSIKGFCVHTAISSCSKNLDRFGGHPMAAGINLKTINIKNFEDDIINYCKIYGDMPYPKLYLDVNLDPSKISLQILHELQKLEPFGEGNPEPIFYIQNMSLQNIMSIGENKHLRLKLQNENSCIEALYFGNTKKDFLYEIGDKLDLAVTLNLNIYKDKHEVSLYLLDIKLSKINMLEVLKQKAKYEAFKLGQVNKEITKSAYFSRNDFAAVYNYLKKKQSTAHRIDIINYKIGWKEYDIFKLYIIIDVLEELKIINADWDSDKFEVTINKVNKKIDLKSSHIISEYFEWRE